MSDAAQYPWTKYWIKDHLADTQLAQCAPATRGIWHDLCCHMALKRVGWVDGTALQLARLARCSESEMLEAIADLEYTEAADVVTHDDETFTIESRRLMREWRSRNGAKERQKRKRKKDIERKSRPMSQPNNGVEERGEKKEEQIQISKTLGGEDSSRARMSRARLEELWIQGTNKSPITSNIACQDRIIASVELSARHNGNRSPEEYFAALVKAMVDVWAAWKGHAPKMNWEKFEEHFSKLEAVVNGERTVESFGERREERTTRPGIAEVPNFNFVSGGDRDEEPT